MRKLLSSKQKPKVDRGFLVLTLTLTVLGLLVVADTSAPQALSVFNDRFYFVKQQAIWAGIGIVGMVVAMQVPYKFWEKIALPAFIGIVITLVLVLIPGLGSKALGARRWLSLGPFSFQPSELVKLGLAIYLAKVGAKDKGALSFFIPIGILAGLIMLQPDLGTTLIVAFVGFVQVFVSGISIWAISASVAVGAVLAFIAVIFSPYRRARLMTFFEHSTDPLDSSYHIRQVLLALGSGGIFGVGLGKSRQKFLFLPESATDSVFAIIAEELGLIGATILIILLAIFIYKGLLIAYRAPDKFSKLLATGIIAWIGGQTLMNIGAMVAIIPLTGIPLPFFSYGGSALTTILIATGILLNISKYAQAEKRSR